MGFTLIECIFVIFCLAITLILSLAVYQSFDAKWRMKIDREALQQIVRTTRLNALVSGQRLHGYIDNTKRTLSIYRAKTLHSQWTLQRADCQLFWRGLDKSIVFEPIFLRNHLAGRLSYHCQRKPLGFQLCLNRFGTIQECHGMDDAKVTVSINPVA